MLKTLYFDHATATFPSEQAIGRMLPFLTDEWGTPAAPHRMGQRLYPAIEEAYRSLYALLGAKEEATLLLTSSGAEAVNHVMQSVYFDLTRLTGKNQYVTGATDEAPALMAARRLEQLGCVSRLAQSNAEGQITAAAIADVLSPRTALVSLSWANGLTGVIQPVAEIAALCQQRGVLFHLDATHVLGKLYFDLADVGADFISFDGDALHGPKGTGGLYLREGTSLSPFICGGTSQNGLRGGNLNVPGLVGLGVACREALEARDLLCTETARLRNLFEKKVLEAYPEALFFFKKSERLPHISAIAFPGILNESLLFALNKQGLCCSIGGGLFQQIGLILNASHVPLPFAHSALSFAFSRATTEEEVIRGAALVAAAAHRLRKLSQHLPQEES